MKKDTLALRVRMDIDEDIEELNKYLTMGYTIVDKTDVAQRVIDISKDATSQNNIYYAVIIFILEREEKE